MVILLLVLTSKVKLFSSRNRRLLYRTKYFPAHKCLRQKKPDKTQAILSSSVFPWYDATQSEMALCLPDRQYNLV